MFINKFSKSICTFGFTILSTPFLIGATIDFNAFNGSAGVLATMNVDPSTGKMSTPTVHYTDTDLFRAEHMMRTDDNRHLVVLNEADDNYVVAVTDMTATPPATTKISTPDRPRFITHRNHYTVVAGHEGQLHLLDLGASSITRSIDLNKHLQPRGTRPEAIAISPDNNHLFALLEQDSDTRKSIGSRIVILSLPDLKVVKDIAIPRVFPDLHFSEGKFAGPGPRWIRFHESTGRTAIGLHLYGTVLFCDTEGLFQGKITNVSLPSTAPDYSIGTSFPDVATTLTIQGKDYLVVSNASEAGGAVLFDWTTSERVATLNTGTRGLTAPVLLSTPNLLTFVKTGLINFRDEYAVDGNHLDASLVLSVDLSGLNSSPTLPVTAADLKDIVYKISNIPGSSNLVLLAARNLETNEMEFITYDVLQNAIMDRQNSVGVLRTILPRQDK